MSGVTRFYARFRKNQLLLKFWVLFFDIFFPMQKSFIHNIVSFESDSCSVCYIIKTIRFYCLRLCFNKNIISLLFELKFKYEYIFNMFVKICRTEVIKIRLVDNSTVQTLSTSSNPGALNFTYTAFNIFRITRNRCDESLKREIIF